MPKLAWILAGAVTLSIAVLVDPGALFPALARSWFFYPARVVELRVALALLGVILAAAPWWRAFLRRDASAEPSESPARAWTLEGLFLVLLVAQASLAWAGDEPMSKDTKFYLGEALDIAQHGGVPGLLARCLDGSWAEDNRHPFFLALLAPSATASNAFLAAARAIAFAGAALTLCLAMRACRRRGGFWAACVCGVVLVTNAAFVEHSILVACESWWTVFAVLAADLATREDMRRNALRWCGVGACVGLAFLTKGTGVLLLIALSAWLVWTLRRRAWRALACVGVGFVATSWPLLVRNQVRFGDALWNVNSRRAFWFDRWEQFYDPAAMQEAGAAHYWATHSAREMLARFGAGASKQVVHLLEACSPVAAHPSLGLPLLALLVVGAAKLADRKQRSFLIALTFVWLASFAWYAQIASDRRFLAVLLPIAMPALVAWTSRLRVGVPVSVRGWSAVGVLALASLAWPLPRLRSASRFEPAPWNESLRAFLHDRTRDDRDALYLLGPSTRLGFDWDRTLLATRRARPVDAAQFATWLGESTSGRYRFLVVESHDGARRLGDDWVDVAANGDLRASTVADGWQPVAAFPPDLPRAIVFERR